MQCGPCPSKAGHAEDFVGGGDVGSGVAGIRQDRASTGRPAAIAGVRAGDTSSCGAAGGTHLPRIQALGLQIGRVVVVVAYELG